MTIELPLLRPEANNLTLVRLVLASAVILSHCYAQAAVGGADPLTPFFLGAQFSVYAVDGFFFLSGFLVYPSLVKRGAAHFMVARLARLWPALAVAVVGSVILGALITSADIRDYFNGPTWHYITTNLLLLGGSYSLTGVTCGEELCIVNGSLWTLTWEARCYLLLGLLGICGLAGQRVILFLVLPAMIAYSFMWNLGSLPEMVRTVAGNSAVVHLYPAGRLGTLFVLGMTASILGTRLLLSWWILAGLFAANLLGHRFGFALLVQPVFVGYAVLCFGFLSARRGAISGRWPDYSYGMYIYAFPIMMLVSGVWPTGNGMYLSIANFALTLPLAIVSWHFVEKPVLDLVRKKGERSFETVAA